MGKANTDVAVTSDQIVDTLNSNLDHASFAELMQLFDAGGVTHIQELDDRVPVEKEALLGMAFVITEWRHNPEGQMGEFVVCKLTTMDDQHLLFTDGSTGIKEQLLTFQKENGNKPIFVPKGLRKSDYTVDDPFNPGKKLAATTYYLSNAS